MAVDLDGKVICPGRQFPRFAGTYPSALPQSDVPASGFWVCRRFNLSMPCMRLPLRSITTEMCGRGGSTSSPIQPPFTFRSRVIRGFPCRRYRGHLSALCRGLKDEGRRVGVGWAGAWIKTRTPLCTSIHTPSRSGCRRRGGRYRDRRLLSSFCAEVRWNRLLFLGVRRWRGVRNRTISGFAKEQ